MIDVGFVGVYETNLESLPSRLRGVLMGNVLGASWLVEIASLALHAEVLAELVKPAKDR